MRPWKGMGLGINRRTPCEIHQASFSNTRTLRHNQYFKEGVFVPGDFFCLLGGGEWGEGQREGK